MGSRRVEHLELPLREVKRRGGARVGAGRKPLPGHLRHTPHRARASHVAAHPVHVTLRSFSRSLRCQQVALTVLGALRESNREWFRVVHYSLQDNHVHLIVEAESTAALGAGVRGLMVRIARRVNRLLFRRGRFWADRWHGRALASPLQVRNALVYVIQNRTKHAHASAGVRVRSAQATTRDLAVRKPVAQNRGTQTPRTRSSPSGTHIDQQDGRPALDPLSSAGWFDGFTEPVPKSFRSVGEQCVATARTWLLRIGWQRRGRIGLTETPKT